MVINISNLAKEKAKEIIDSGMDPYYWKCKPNQYCYDFSIKDACLIANGNFITIICDAYHFTFDDTDFQEVMIV